MNFTKFPLNVLILCLVLLSVSQVILKTSQPSVLGKQTISLLYSDPIPTTYPTPIGGTGFPVPSTTPIILPPGGTTTCGLLDYSPILNVGTTCPGNMAQSVKFTCTNGYGGTSDTGKCNSYDYLRQTAANLCINRICLLYSTPTPAINPTIIPAPTAITNSYVQCRDLISFYDTRCPYGGSSVVPYGTISCPSLKSFIYLTSGCPTSIGTSSYPTPTLAYSTIRPLPTPTLASSPVTCNLTGISAINWCDSTTASQATYTCSNGYKSTYTSSSCLSYDTLKVTLGKLCQANCRTTNSAKPLPPTLQY